jgi:hypothetical protein
MGITAYEDTFKSKNTYENILTGINKEAVLTENIERNTAKSHLFKKIFLR